MTATLKITVPEKTARAIEELGWSVERQKDGGKRVLVCTRGAETVKLRWDRNAQNRDVFTRGLWVSRDSIESVAVALKLMAAQDGASLAHLEDDELTAVLEGRTLTWRNRISGGLEEAEAVHVIEVTQRPNGRSVGVTCAEGFRAVYVAQIESVK